MNDKQKLFVMVGIASFLVLLVSIFGLGFLPYTVSNSKQYKMDPLMDHLLLLDTEMKEMVEKRVDNAFGSFSDEIYNIVENYYKYLNYTEQRRFRDYVKDYIEYKKWLRAPNVKTYYFEPEKMFKIKISHSPIAYSTNWLGIIAIFNIAISATGYFLFKDK